ncbi:siderophore-interacting protein [Trueperella bialowiezensis]|uniref:Vibriobactin utilization protein ViuB n=1 Tax=Trueperella bialowiezensis TaxID=312285 RepID=A0A448PF51_9ACTO|nr:siderophore-interacting protein [Trueperella bialowiezensis]VEI13514.1 Vibriobactin utilization protein ViuB [Trueperella bialowiezensis]
MVRNIVTPDTDKLAERAKALGVTVEQLQAMLKRRGKATEATVTHKERISRDLIRLSFDCPGLKGADLPFTDHYIKLLFVPEGADYEWPYDVANIRETKPREMWPVTRTYTLRHVDTEEGTFTADFVTHGTQGLAGPWAEHAKVGDAIGFLGPGGAWRPDSKYEHFVFAGDESAAPAICAGLEALPEGASATAYIEIADDDAKFAVPGSEHITVNWVKRDGATHGTALIEAVRAGGYPEKKTAWFIHGVAEMVKDTRRFLFVDGDVAKEDASISGYWRLGMTEDQWQASKADFNKQNEAEEAAAREQA